MRVLVTNDDGWHAPGLKALVRAIGVDHEVYVAAPTGDRSGSGLALGILDDGHRLAVDDVVIEGAHSAWSIDAPPAMCVYTAFTALGVRPEMVVSGINAGHNTGMNLGHSGTFGGAWMAARFGVPAVAISVGYEPGARFDTAATVTGWLIEHSTAIPRGCVLNTNVPDVDLSDLGLPVEAPLAPKGLQRVELTRAEGSIVVRALPSEFSPGDTGVVLESGLSMSLIRAQLAVEPVPTTLLQLNIQE